MADPLDSDDQATALKALRARLVVEMSTATGRDFAALAHQHRMVIARLAEVAPKEGQSLVDEIASRRANRKQKAAGS